MLSQDIARFSGDVISEVTHIPGVGAAFSVAAGALFNGFNAAASAVVDSYIAAQTGGQFPTPQPGPG